MYRQSEKSLLNSNISSTCPHNMANFGQLAAEIGSGVWGTPANFNGVSRLGFVTAVTSFTGCQPNFARCLAVSWAATLYIHFRWLLLPDKISPRAKFTASKSCVLLYLQHYCVALKQRDQTNFAAWYKEWNYGTFSEGTTYIRLGGHHVWHRPTF